MNFSQSPETLFEEFVIRKRAFSLSRGTKLVTFKFEDNKWYLLDILKPSDKDCEAVVNFSKIPSWLLFDVKCYIAHLWLETSTNAREVNNGMVSLRFFGRIFSNFSGKPIDFRKKQALQFHRLFKKRNHCANYNEKTFRFVNRFMSFVRQQHPQEKGNDFVIDIPSRKRPRCDYKPLEQSQNNKISTEVLAALIDACEQELNSYLTALRNWPYPDPTEFPKEYSQAACRRYKQRKRLGLPGGQGLTLRELLSRAIKAQVVKLMICVGRRASAICNSPFAIKADEVEWVDEAGVVEKTVLVRFRETKIKNVDEDVACPGAFGELAANAIKTTKNLTANLRRDNPQWAGYLFLVPSKKAKSARVVSADQINKYLNGYVGTNGRSKGLLQRFNIAITKITTHNFRLTRATNLWAGGMNIHDVADDLGHRSAEMTIRHYIAGTEESRRRYQSFIDQQAVTGAVIDFIDGQEVLNTRLSVRHVEIMKSSGVIVMPNRYGYCARHACLGTCDRATPCYTGPGGIECDFHILSPDALPALQEDKEVVEANIAAYSNKPEFASWVNNSRNQLVVIERKINQASILKERHAGNEDTQLNGETKE